MKKIALKFIFCATMMFSGVAEGAGDIFEKRESLSRTCYSCEEIGEYWPNMYLGFKSDVVYTAQLKVQENIVARLDRGYIQNSKLVKTLFEGNTNLKSLELRLNIVIGIIAVLALMLMLFLLYIALLLKRFETSIRGNLKVLDGNIHAIYGKVSKV